MKTFPIILTLLVLLTGCQDDKYPDFLKLKGCMLEYATNYKKRAAVENESCKFGDSELEGIYVFSDSSLSGIEPIWYYGSNIEHALHKMPKTVNQWVFIKPFRPQGSLSFDYYETYNLEFECYLNGDSLRFPHQHFTYDQELSFTRTESGSDFTLSTFSNGYFRNDSLFLYLNYWWNDGDGTIEHLWGVKK